MGGREGREMRAYRMHYLSALCARRASDLCADDAIFRSTIRRLLIAVVHPRYARALALTVAAARLRETNDRGTTSARARDLPRLEVSNTRSILRYIVGLSGEEKLFTSLSSPLLRESRARSFGTL